jgi:hypothetical protein
MPAVAAGAVRVGGGDNGQAAEQNGNTQFAHRRRAKSYVAPSSYQVLQFLVAGSLARGLGAPDCIRPHRVHRGGRAV